MRPPDTNKRATTRIAAPPHCVPYLEQELREIAPELDLQIQHTDNAGVHVGATIPQAITLALRLRTAVHVLYQLATFRCPSLKALTKHIAAYPWEQLIPIDGYFSIKSAVTHPSIDNDLYANRLVKDAIADRFAQRLHKRPDSGPERTGVLIHLYWHDDRATLYLNINGRPLSDRGYRKLPHNAPMRETLAAAVLKAAGYDATTPLINPMCGSGTLAIEAALIAANRPPGLLRSDYAILNTNLPDIQTILKNARADAKRLARTPNHPIPPIIASDHDPAAIHAAQKNATTAGVQNLIQFQNADFAETTIPQAPGHIILNPEYGLRLGDTTQLANTYHRLGEFLKNQAAGHTAHIFTANRELAKRIALRPTSKVPFRNANIECRLLTYPLRPASTPNERPATGETAPTAIPKTR